jgi:hypothetical protein
MTARFDKAASRFTNHSLITLIPHGIRRRLGELLSFPGWIIQVSGPVPCDMRLTVDYECYKIHQFPDDPTRACSGPGT